MTLSAAWRTLATSQPQWVLVTVGTFVVHELVWAVFNSFYLLLARFSLCERYRIQRHKRVDFAAQWADFTALLRGHFLILLPLILLSYPLMSFFHIHASPALPSWRLLLVQQLVFNVIEDAGFYWIHRLMHHPELFRRFHAQHHRYTQPYSLAGGIASPVEFLFNFLLPLIAGPFLFGYLHPHGVHVVSLWLWITFREMRSTDSHSGYNLPFHPLRLLSPIYGGPLSHDWHHCLIGVKSNFGGYKFWDWLCGTMGTPKPFVE